MGDGLFRHCRVQASPEAFQPVNRLDREKSKQGAENPEAGENAHDGALAGEDSVTEDQNLSHGNDDQQEKNNAGQPGADSQRYPPPMRSEPPQSGVPGP